jgi:hypothetical protein
MTTFQMWMVGLGIAGCLITAGGIVGGCVRSKLAGQFSRPAVQKATD